MIASVRVLRACVHVGVICFDTVRLMNKKNLCFRSQSLFKLSFTMTNISKSKLNVTCKINQGTLTQLLQVYVRHIIPAGL